MSALNKVIKAEIELLKQDTHYPLTDEEKGLDKVIDRRKRTRVIQGHPTPNIKDW